MNDTKRRTVLKGVGAGVAVVVGSAGTTAADEHGDDGDAALRVAHASPDAPSVDVLVDGNVVVDSLSFRDVTGYLEFPAGAYEIAVNVAGTDTTVFGPVEVELGAEDYTGVALGEVTGGDTDFTVSLLEDTNGANLADDEARVRAIHASPDAPAVDVTVNDGLLTVFDGVAFGESSGYAGVPAGTYDVEVRPDTPDDDGPVVFEASAVTLEGGSTYTVFALGYLTPDDEPADEAFGLLPTLDASAPPRRGRGGDDEDEEDDGDEDETGEDDEKGRGRGTEEDDD